MARPTKGPDGKPIRLFRDQAGFHAWLEKHHSSSTGVWLRMAKKASGLKSVTYDEALEVALCYGWIDGQGRREDDDYTLQKFTPRTKRSIWSKRNRERVQALIESGLMRPAGLAEIERAREDGRWDAAYDSPSTMEVPEDLRAALKKSRNAQRFFEGLNSQNRYAILFRIQTARKAETRARRIEQFVQMLEKGEKLYP